MLKNKWLWAGIIIVIIALGYWQKDNIVPKSEEQKIEQAQQF